MPKLSYAGYGKDNVRVLKVQKEETGVHSVFEFTVQTVLEGDIETSYTKADNAVIVPTDTQKQTAYIVAKQHHVDTPEMYAAILAQHFIDRYPHIHVATANVTQHRWTRMTVDEKPHPHSFARDGAETRIVQAVASRGKGISVKGGIKDLLVLKSTGSAFYGYDTADKYTILPETNDRILSTAVNCGWLYKQFDSIDAIRSAESKFNPAFEKARKITMDTFAKEESPSVQNTMYKMSEQILEAVPEVAAVDYTLPNKHYFEINLSWFEGLKNTGKDAEVYAPQSDPNGLIHCMVTRD